MAALTKEKSTADKLKWTAALLAALLLMLLFAVALIQKTALFPFPGEKHKSLRSNPYGEEDFAYENGFLKCIAGESWVGIDVSHHQGIIDWMQVAASDVEFAMIRMGHRTVDEGQLRSDRMGQKNLQGAIDAGLKVGVYFYSQAISVEEATEEARFLLDMLGDVQLQMPVVFDWEILSPQARTANVDSQILNACAIAFCDVIREAGYEPMIYFNQDIAKRLFDLQQMQERGYDFWLAMYSDKMTWPYQVDMWQYTDSGRVKGIETNVDLNVYLVS